MQASMVEPRHPASALLVILVFAPVLGGPPTVPAPDPARTACEEAVGEAIEAVAGLHWSPAIRAVAADSAGGAGRACAGGVGATMAIHRALAVLDDPAIRALEPAHFERTLEEWNGTPRVGVGLAELLSIDTDEATRRLTVVAPVPGSPAARAGLRAGDVVTAIDGMPTDSLGLTRTVERLRVAEGETVRLAILRGSEARDVRLAAERIPALDALRIEELWVDGRRVLLVRLVQFTPGVTDSLRARVTSDGNVDALILDLRDNPGGLLEELRGTAGVFLPRGSMLAEISGPAPITLRTDAAPVAVDVPLEVLVGPGTASAAEVLAAALRSHGRARLFGERTYGKGLVHRAVPLVDGRWILMLPVGQLETPEGRRVLGNGVDPDLRTGSPLERAAKAPG